MSVEVTKKELEDKSLENSGKSWTFRQTNSQKNEYQINPNNMHDKYVETVDSSRIEIFLKIYGINEQDGEVCEMCEAAVQITIKKLDIYDQIVIRGVRQKKKARKSNQKQ